MKHFIFLLSFFISTTVYCQNKVIENEFIPNHNNYRISKSEYFEGSQKPKYVYDYKYDKKGLIQSISQNYNLKGTLIPVMTKEFKYNSKKHFIICIYKPSSSIPSNIPEREIKNKKGDLDTVKFENGKVVSISQFRKEKYGDYLYQFKYTYENENLISVKKLTYSYSKTNSGKLYLDKNIGEIFFLFENSKLKNITENNSMGKFKWVLNWNDLNLDKIEGYNIINENEKLLYEYECKNENNKLSHVTNFLLRNDNKMNIKEIVYKYDDNNNLIESNSSDDSGFSIYKYSYEPGNGNASIFEEKKLVYDYIKPIIK